MTHSENRRISADITMNWYAILNCIPGGAYICDAAGLIAYFSPRAEAAWGRTPKLRDPADRYCGSFRMHSKEGAPLRHDECWMALALRDGREYHAREVRIERPDGMQIMNRAFAHPLRNDRNEVVGAVNLIQRSRADDESSYDDATLAMIEVGLAVLLAAPMAVV